MLFYRDVVFVLVLLMSRVFCSGVVEFSLILLLCCNVLETFFLVFYFSGVLFVF